MNALSLTTPDPTDADVLLVEHCDADIELALRRLAHGGLRCTHRIVSTERALRKGLEERLPDVILCDFTLPDFDGMSALKVAAELAPDVPFIFLSGTMGEERAIEALHRGAVDYVLKSNLLRLVPAVKRALAEARQRQAGRAAQRQVQRLTGVLQMLSGINTAVLRIRDREALLKEACRLAHRLGDYPFAIIATRDPNSRVARPVAFAGVPADAASRYLFEVSSSEHADTSLVGRVMRTGEVALCDDVAQSKLPIAGRENLLAAGVHALACLPLRVDDTPVGAFVFGTREPGLVSQEELKLLEEVAANLSFALQYLDKQDEAHFLAYFDPLTGLAKRALFCERLARLLVRGPKQLPRLAVRVFDIDHLSVINDSLGRHVGDRLLQQVADRLRQQCVDTDRLAHLGGGTFVSFQALGEGSPEETVHLHREVPRLFDAPFTIDGREIAVTVKCGIACYPENGSEADQLVQNAEAALKEAKISGQKYLHHRLEMNSALAERVRMENQLRTALQNNQFELHYQPKLHIQTARVESAEALLRWRDPERGLISPGAFLPILETAGLMPAVTAWALGRAAADARAWRRANLPPIRVAVNVRPADLRRRGFVQEVLEAIGDLVSDPAWGLDIEVTEGALFGDSASCIHPLRLLRKAGMRVAIDDFGTGHSSLGRLFELPIDTLKIDRLFVKHLPGERRNCKLTATIIELAHTFDLTAVAEGVETAEQFEYLARCGCDESQGYFHCRPIPKADFESYLVRINR
ncbi:MAG TPA: EAL domain-containing protein [Steroidobacteraceae bacterium]|nr:EAL domain-containing protein [Steroidobacteraceae bacterium]